MEFSLSAIELEGKFLQSMSRSIESGHYNKISVNEVKGVKTNFSKN